VAFALPFLLPSLNVRDRQHWAERHRQQVTLQQEIMVAIGGPRYYPRPPYERARLTVVRISTGQLDRDNAAASVKALADCLKARSERNPLGLSIIVDDNPARLELVVQQQHAATLAAQQTLVRIEELPYEAPQPILGKSGKSKRPMTREQMAYIKRHKHEPVALAVSGPPEDFNDPDWVEKWLDGKTAIMAGG
jgi:hypothetical protein